MDVRTAPHREIEMISGVHGVTIRVGNIVRVRRIPYAPSLSRTLARIIEPATGASTCALGSHRWVKYIGSFTKKARRRPAERRRLLWLRDWNAKCKDAPDLYL